MCFDRKVVCGRTQKISNNVSQKRKKRKAQLLTSKSITMTLKPNIPGTSLEQDVIAVFSVVAA